MAIKDLEYDPFELFEHFGGSVRREKKIEVIQDGDWRCEPLPLREFIASEQHLSFGGARSLFPKQEEDLLNFLGNDPKRLFSPEQQTDFSQAFLLWGKGCLGKDEKLTDHATGLTLTVKEWAESGKSLTLPSWNGDQVVVKQTSPVYKKGEDKLYRVTLEDGRSFVATSRHKILTPSGFREVGYVAQDILRGLPQQLFSIPPNACSTQYKRASEERNQSYGLGDQVLEPKNGFPQESPDRFSACEGVYKSSPSHTDSLLTHGENALNENQKAGDSQFGYRFLPRLCDEQPQKETSIFPVFAPSQNDVLEYSHYDHGSVSFWRRGDRKPLPVSNHAFQLSCRYLVNTCHKVAPAYASEPHDVSVFFLQSLLEHQVQKQSVSMFDLGCKDQRLYQHQIYSFPFVISNAESFPHYSKIQSIEDAGYGEFYDLTVPETHNYFDSQGICHHNSGKDLCVSYVQAWILHVLLCLNNPQKFLGLAPDESIDVVVIGYNQNQARDVYFTKFLNLLSGWQWLRDTIDELAPNVGSDRWLRRGGEYRGAEKFEAPNKIRCWSLPSTPNSGEGKNIIFFVLDELAAFSSPVKVNQAKAIHDMVVSSARSRFPKGQWKGFAISYPRHKEDYMMKMVRLAESGQAKDLYWSRRPTWEVNPLVTRQDLDLDFQRDPEGAAMRYGCEPPAAVDAFFRSPDEIILHAWGAPEYLVREVLPHASPEEISAIASRGKSPIADLDIKGDIKLDHRGFPKLAKWFQPSPQLEYFVHLDPGKSGDAFGFGMGHLQPSGEKEIPVLDLLFRWTGEMFNNFGEILRESYFSDTVEQRENISAAEVDFRTVREFIYFLKFKLGFNIIHCSYDGWNSVEYAQSLRNRDIGCSELVIKKKQYDELKSLIYQRKIKYYANPIFVRECQKLQILNGEKIDAPRTVEGEGRDPDSHKDIADCGAGLAYRLTRLRENWVEYGQLEDAEAYLEKVPPDRVDMTRDQLNENQRKLFDLFFNE